jgi:hypothetical protein
MPSAGTCACVIGVVLALSASRALSAQAVAVGHVSDIKSLGELRDCAKRPKVSNPPSDAVTIRRGDASRFARAGRDESVRLYDQVNVRAKTDVRVRLESNRFGRGALYLAPGLVECTRIEHDHRAYGSLVHGDARYAILTDSGRTAAGPRDRARGGALAPTRPPLLILVDRGAAFIQWSGGGRLVIEAIGRQAYLDSTEVAVIADSAGQRALIYVRSGLVTILGGPDGGPDLQARAGEMYEVEREGLTRPQPPPGPDFAANLQYYSRTVFLRFWERPGFYLPAGGGVAVTAALLIWRPWDGDGDGSGPLRGTVRIPLPF